MFENTASFMFLGLFLTILPLLSGYAFRLSNQLTLSDALKVSFFLMCVSFVMNTMVWGLQSNLSWNVLQLLSLSFIVVSLLHRVIAYKFGLLLLSIAILLLSEPVRDALGNYTNTGLALLFGEKDTHSILWPIFPWFATFLFGFSIADLYLSSRSKKKFIYGALLCGTCFLMYGIITGGIVPSIQEGYIFMSTLIHPSTGWIISTVGFFLTLFALEEIFIPGLTFSSNSIITIFSKGILFAYGIQMFFGSVFAVVFKKIITDHPLNIELTYLVLMPLLFCMEVFICWKLTKYCIDLFSSKNIIISFKKIKQ
jgi:hypothetical protein